MQWAIVANQLTIIVTGLEAGFKEFDQLTLGLQLGDLIVVGDRPGIGKTTFERNVGFIIA